MILKVYCYRAVSGILFFLTVPLSLSSCRVQVEKPEGETPSGEKLDPNLPKDARLFDLFSNVAVVDYTKEPNYTKCTINEYEPEEETNDFPAEPSSPSQVNEYSYDSQGRRLKTITTRKYGSTEIKSASSWVYDDQGRVSKTIGESYSVSGGWDISDNCVYTYDGDSERLTKRSCFTGDKSDEESMTDVVEISYDISQLTRKVTIKSRSSSSPDLSLSSVTTETHADNNYSLAVKTIAEYYKYDETSKEAKLDGDFVYDVKFSDGKMSGIDWLYSSVKNDKKYKDIQGSCEYKDGKMSCLRSEYNETEEVYVTGTTSVKPVLYKFRPSDVFGCNDYNFCTFSADYSLKILDFDIVSSYIEAGVEGKLDSDGKSPNKKREVNLEYIAELRPWNISRPASESEYTVKSDDTHEEEKSISTVSNDGNTITTIKQARAKNGEAKSKEELGDWKNVSKESVVCELN